MADEKPVEGSVPAPEPTAEKPAGPKPEDEIAALKQRLAAAEDKVRRQAAEFVNETRRIQRQAEERVRYAIQPVVEDLLAVADALHNGIEGLKDSEHERRVAAGLGLVERTLLETLARYGVARIDALGKPFDPSIHEAILEMESEGPPKTVIQVVRPGFTLHGRVVRAAHVIVSRAAAPPAAPPSGEKPPAPPPTDGPGGGKMNDEPE